MTRRLAVALTSAVLAVGFVGAAFVYSRTTVKLELSRIEGIAAADPELGVMSFSESNTWDHLLLLRSHPDWRERFVAGLPPTPPPRLLVISHRAPLLATELAALRDLGYGAPETIQEVAPTGFTELSGDLNGGNGAYVVLMHRVH